MKNSLRTLMAIVVGSVGLLAALPVEAATSAGIAITVTVNLLAVSVTDGTVVLSSVDTDSDTVSGTAQVVTNGGNVTETYTLQLTGKDVYAAGVNETDVAENQFVLQALFTGNGDSAPASGVFGNDPTAVDDMVLEASAQAASSTTYGWSANTADGDSVGGGELRDLYFMYSAPTSVTTGAEEGLTVTIAVQGA